VRSPSPRFGQSSWILLHFAHLLKLIASGSWIVSSPARRCSAKLPYLEVLDLGLPVALGLAARDQVAERL